MSQALLEKEKKALKSPFHFEWKPFKTLVKMLLANTFSLDLKHQKKKAILQLLLALLAFAAVTGISFLFYYVSIRFMIFSLLAYVPMSVPSILVSILLIFSFIGTLSKLCDALFFAPDNKILLTLPASGTTLFLARLFVFFLKVYSRSLLLEIPILLGYFLISGYPFYMIPLLFVFFAFIDLLLVLVASLFAMPLYYCKRFLRTHGKIRFLWDGFWLLLLVALASFLIALMPEKIDIFSNWAPYFAKIQQGLSFYTNSLSFFYRLSMVYLGNFTGFSFSFFSGNAIPGLWYFLGILLLIPMTLFLSMLFVGPFYLRLASESGELLARVKGKGEEKSRVHSPAMSQLKKEGILFFGDSSLFSSYLSAFLFLPILFALLNRFFGAMDLNYRGEGYVQIVDLLLLCLIATSANGLVSRLYSAEGGAFQLARTYPIGSPFLIGSKLIFPALFGSVSILSTSAILSALWPKMGDVLGILGVASLFIYLGHLLYSASLDFVSPKTAFAETSFLSNNENRSVIASFFTSGFFALLFYYFSRDPLLWFGSVPLTASVKILLLSLLYLGLMGLLYYRKLRYVYMRGETL